MPLSNTCWRMNPIYFMMQLISCFPVQLPQTTMQASRHAQSSGSSSSYVCAHMANKLKGYLEYLSHILEVLAPMVTIIWNFLNNFVDSSIWCEKSLKIALNSRIPILDLDIHLRKGGTEFEVTAAIDWSVANRNVGQGLRTSQTTAIMNWFLNDFPIADPDDSTHVETIISVMISFYCLISPAVCVTCEYHIHMYWCDLGNAPTSPGMHEVHRSKGLSDQLIHNAMFHAQSAYKPKFRPDCTHMGRWIGDRLNLENDCTIWGREFFEFAFK